jgi:hypothetical protein
MTRKVTLLVSCLIAALAATAALAAISSATMTLPTFSGTATPGTGDSTTVKLTVKGGASLTCTSSTESLTFNSGSRNLGPATLHFEGCEQLEGECHSLGATGKMILLTGEWHLVLDLNPKDEHFLLFLLPSFGVHIECPNSPVKLLVVTGSVLGLITLKAGSTTEYSVIVKATATAQEYTEYENDGGTVVNAHLKTVQEGTGEAKESLENAEKGLLSFPAATSIEN